MIPRLLMGTLAVFDTFLIYLIAQRRYNSRNVAHCVFNLDNLDYKTYSGDPLDASKRAILIADQGLVRALPVDTETSKVLKKMYSSNSTKKTIITFGDDGPKSSQVSILSYDPILFQLPS